MALVGNGVRLASNPMMTRGGANVYAVFRGLFNAPGASRNFYAGPATVEAGASIANKNAIPSGYVHPACWVLAPKPGGMASFVGLAGASSLAASGANGLAADATISGSGVILGFDASAILPADATLTGSGSIITAIAAGSIAAAATLGGSGVVSSALLGALAELAASVSGSGSVQASTASASGELGATITAAGDVVTPGSVAAAVWESLAADHFTAGTMGEMLSLIAGMTQQNFVLDACTYSVDGLLTAGRMRLFSDPGDVAAATDGGTGEGEIAVFEISSTAESGHPAQAGIYRVRRTS